MNKFFFYASYYSNNLIHSKISGTLLRKKIARFNADWGKIYEQFHHHTKWLVVGNGPSLNIKDLEALAHIPAIASNKISLLYQNTHWRPSLYTIGDPLLLHKLPQIHYDAIPLSLMPHTTYYMARTKKKIAWKSLPLETGRRQFLQSGFSPDPIKNGFIAAKTVTTANIQLAMWLGAKTIYLIGCDHNYSEEKHGNVKKLQHGTENNHFHPEYRKEGEIVNNAPISIMDQGYSLIREIADKRNVRIINISRKTALQAFELSSVEDISF